MIKIRIQNDIILRVEVTRLGQAEDFTGKKLLLTVKSVYECKVLPYSISGNVLTAVWLGSQQTKTGTYTLTLKEDNGNGSINTVDCCDCFALVPRSCQESCLTGAQTIYTSADISHSSGGDTIDVDLNVGVPSNGLSAYEIAQRNGYKGTEAEWLASLRADDRVSSVLPFCGYVAGATVSEGSCAPDFVAFDEDTSTFVGAVKQESGYVAYYNDFDAYCGMTASDYGVKSDNGRVPTLQKMFVNTEDDSLLYWNGTEMRAVASGFTDEEIEEIIGN